MKSSCISLLGEDSCYSFPYIKIKLDSVVDMSQFTDAVNPLLITKTEPKFTYCKKRESVCVDYFSFDFRYNNQIYRYSWVGCYEIGYSKKYLYLMRMIFGIFDYLIKYIGV